MKLATLLLAFALVMGCHPRAHDGLGLSSKNKETFGDKVKSHKTLSLESISKQLTEKDTIYTTTIGDVTKVCQKKGCWMTLKPINGEEPEFMVRFKDYGFFMPKDISGEKVIIQGKAFKQLTDVETLKHYAEDAGKSEEYIASIKEPKEDWIFIADAVELYRKKVEKN